MANQNDITNPDGELSGTPVAPSSPGGVLIDPTGAELVPSTALDNVWKGDGSGGWVQGVAPGAPPSGSAGGDLSGTYPNPAVATVGGTAAATVGSHPADSANPHGVTAAQAGADGLVTGLITGGELSINGGDPAKFDLAAGSGVVVNNHADPTTPVIIPVSWAQFTLQTPTGLGSETVSFVGIDSSGAIVQQIADFTRTQLRDVIRIGIIGHTGATISSILTEPHVAFNKHLEFLDFVEAFGPMNFGGNVYSANGANLFLNKSAGSGYRTGANYVVDKKIPSITTEPLQTALEVNYTYQDVGPGFTVDGDTAGIAPGLYDDGDGTPGAVGATQWTIQRIFYFLGSAQTVIHYGQNLYASLEDAEAAHNEIILFNPIVEAAVFRSWLLVRGDATDLSDPTQAKFIAAGKLGLTDVVTGGGVGENNTASNVGIAGVGVFKSKSGVDLQFKKINAGSSKVAVTDDVANDEIDIDVVEAQISHDALADFLVTEHRVINDAGTSTTEMWSADKIDSEISTLASGLDLKAGVDTTTFGVGDITLSGEQTLNGLLTSTSRVLVVEQTLPEENGIYDTGVPWTRALDADGSPSNEVSNGNMLHVLNSGSDDFKSKYILVTADPITVGTTGQDWERHRDIDFGTTSGTATEGNDTRVPTQDENDALVGTSGAPSTANKYVTDVDARNTNERTPVDDSATNAKLADMAANTVKVRNVGSSGDPVDLALSEQTVLGRITSGVVAALTALQLTALLNVFTSTLKGLAPASLGGTANFLRADGTWVAPPGVTAVETSFPLVTTTSASYVVVGGARFRFRGTTALGTPTAVVITGGIQGTATGSYRLQDITNALTIAEATGVATADPASIDLGTLSNLPAGPAIFQLEFRRDTGTGGNVPAASSVSVDF